MKEPQVSYIPVLIPCLKVQHIEPEEYPVEVLSTSLQDESYNGLHKPKWLLKVKISEIFSAFFDAVM